MKNKNPLALGLMSGTSADGLTLAAMDIKKQICLSCKTYPYPKKLQAEILQAINYTAPKLAKLDYALGRLYLKLAKKFKPNKYKSNTESLPSPGYAAPAYRQQVPAFRHA